MNQRRAADFPVTPGMRRAITLISLNIRTAAPKSAPNFVYEALTILGKDCEHIGQKSINAYQARPKPTPISNSR
jgi:hypothetical protein